MCGSRVNATRTSLDVKYYVQAPYGRAWASLRDFEIARVMLEFSKGLALSGIVCTYKNYSKIIFKIITRYI